MQVKLRSAHLFVSEDREAVLLNSHQPLPQLDTFTSLPSASTSAPAAPCVGTQRFAGCHTSVLEKPGSHSGSVSGLFSLQSSRCELTFPDTLTGKKSTQPCVAHGKQGTFSTVPLEMATPPPPHPTSSWALHMPVGQDPASTLVLPTVIPRSWILFLLI